MPFETEGRAAYKNKVKELPQVSSTPVDVGAGRDETTACRGMGLPYHTVSLQKESVQHLTLRLPVSRAGDNMFLLCKILNWWHLVTASPANKCSRWLKLSQHLPLIMGRINRQRSLTWAMFSIGKGFCKEKVPFQTQISPIPSTSNTAVSSHKPSLCLLWLQWLLKDFWSTTMAKKLKVDLWMGGSIFSCQKITFIVCMCVCLVLWGACHGT